MHSRKHLVAFVLLAAALAITALGTARVLRSHGQAANVAPLDSASGGKSLDYRNDTYHFALDYPADLVVEEFDENDGSRTIVMQRPAGKVGFQISISSDSGTLSKERLAHEFPALEMQDVEELIVGSSTPSLSFIEDVPGYGQMRDVWFTHDGYLFQITSFPYLDTWLAPIIQSWHFL